MKTKKSKYIIRPVTDGDDVTAIEEIDKFTFPIPLTSYMLVRMLNHRRYRFIVITHYDVVVGYLVYESIRDDFNIIRFAVAPDFHRRGVGRRLIHFMKRKADEKSKSTGRTSNVRVDVSEYNDEVHSFLKDSGFLCMKVLPHPDEGIDYYRFVYS